MTSTLIEEFLAEHQISPAHPYDDTYPDLFYARWDRIDAPIYVEIVDQNGTVRAARCLVRCLLWDDWMVLDQEHCWHGLRSTSVLDGSEWVPLDLLPVELSDPWLELWRNRSMTDDAISAMQKEIHRLQCESEAAKKGYQVADDHGELRSPDPLAAQRLAEIEAMLLGEWEKATTQVRVTEDGLFIRRWQGRWYIARLDIATRSTSSATHGERHRSSRMSLISEEPVSLYRLFDSWDEYVTHTNHLQRHLKHAVEADALDSDDLAFLDFGP